MSGYTVPLKVEVNKGGVYRLIKAKMNGRVVGFYELCFFDDYKVCDSGVLLSRRQNAGIPRAMISRASQEINSIAKRKRIVIRHWGGIVTRKGEEKLPHIFQELGYRRFRQEKYSRHSELVKIYCP